MPQPVVAASSPLRFGVFEFDPAAHELRKNGRKLKVEGQPLQVLQVLLERPGQVVTREELQQKLWATDTFVDFEHGINSVIKRLRQALDDSAQTPRFIETLPRRGYRFIYPLAADLHLLAGDAEASVRGTRASRRLAIVGVCLAALVAGLSIVGFRNSWKRPVSEPTTWIAVLPVEGLTGGGETGEVWSQLHADLIAQLSGIRVLRVISRDSVLQVDGARTSLAAVATMLNVDAVLRWEVRRERERWRVAARLLSAGDGRRLWSDAYDRDDRELTLLPAELARSLAAALRLPLSPAEVQRLSRAQPVNPALYRAYANGRHHLQKWTSDGAQKAIAYFQEALDIDATYAPAWAGLGDAYVSPGGPESEGATVDEDRRRRAEAALLRALDCDPTLSEARRTLGRIRFNSWDWEGGVREFEQARDLDPEHPGFSYYLLTVGRLDEAVAAQRLAARLNPLDYASQLTVGWTAFMAGQFDEAVRALKTTIELDRRIPHGHRELAWAYARKGMAAEAANECVLALELTRAERPAAFVAAGCEWVYALVGRRAEALDLAQRIEQAPGGGPHRFIRLAHVYDALGDRERALASLRQAYEAKAAGLPRQWYVPMLSDGIKRDPRFQELVRRTGIPWARFPAARSVINPPGRGNEP